VSVAVHFASTILMSFALIQAEDFWAGAIAKMPCFSCQQHSSTKLCKHHRKKHRAFLAIKQ